MYLRLTERTERRARDLLAAAAELCAMIDPVGERRRVPFGSKGSEKRRPRFMAPHVASMAAKARRLVADGICLSRILERAASGQRPESELETEDGSSIGEKPDATKAPPIAGMPDGESGPSDSPDTAP